jgi:8-oxo-dGTP diphosphatase
MPQNPRFVVRVYGLIVQEGCLLVSHESYKGVEYVKLPGGGMEHHEGPEDTLKRELKEEMDVEVASLSLFAAYPAAIESKFHPDTHIVCLYYQVELTQPFSTEAWKADPRFAHTENNQHLHWVPLHAISADLFSLASERYLAPLLHALDSGH